MSDRRRGPRDGKVRMTVEERRANQMIRSRRNAATSNAKRKAKKLELLKESKIWN